MRRGEEKKEEEKEKGEGEEKQDEIVTFTNKFYKRP